MTTPDLGLPRRSSKPRRTGRTHLIDKGTGLRRAADDLAAGADFIDLVKLGWGTGLVDPLLAERIALYHDHGVDICFGGTMFEIFWLKNRVGDYRSWLLDLGVDWVEISDGTIEMADTEKLAAIERFAADFVVVSEVGSKDANQIVAPARWVRAIRDELESGARYVILEGRESGTAGLYRPSGEIRTGLIEEILDAGISPERLVFEAPGKAQQVYMIDLIGPEVNLGNVAMGEAIAVETLRLGLRSDTLLGFHGGA